MTVTYRVINRLNLKFGNHAFSISGPRDCNRLPTSVRHCTSVAQFMSIYVKIPSILIVLRLRMYIMRSRARLVFVEARYVQL